MIQKVREFLSKQRRWIILFVGLILFFSILENLFENEIEQLDTTIYHAISYTISDTFTHIVKFITQIGSAPVILTVMLVVMLMIRNKKINWCIFGNLVLVTFLNQGLKRIIARPRPMEHRIIHETGYSFPSGHSMVSMAFYGFFIYLAYKKIKNPHGKRIICIGLSILILLIGASRIYLGVHYPSDVIAGFCLSLSYLALFTNVIKKYIE